MPALFDASIYISALRTGKQAVLVMRRLSEQSSLWLSAVVLEELYAGANPRQVSTIRRLEHDFERARRILVPNLTDWTHAGKAISELSAAYTYEPIGRGILTNDALIAMRAGRMGITIITANARDFGRLAEFRPFQWRTESF